MAGKGGGAWKVAYADFVTAMMAFFLVMWLLAQSKPVKQAVAQYFNDPYGSSKKAGAGSSGGAPAGGYSAAKGGAPAGPRYTLGAPASGGRPDKGPSPKKTKGEKVQGHALRQEPLGAMLPVPSDEEYLVRGGRIQFDLEQDALDADQDAHVRQMAAFLMGKNQKIEVRGHASRQPLGPDSKYRDRWDLSYARCCAVRDALTKHGVDARRIRLAVAADNEPVTALHDAQTELRRSSRVEVRLLPEFVDATTGLKEKPRP